MTVLAISEMTHAEHVQFEQRPMRLAMQELFRIGPNGLEEISDRTLDMKLDAEERRALENGSMTLSQSEPLEAV